jgi:hypothetical protein
MFTQQNRALAACLGCADWDHLSHSSYPLCTPLTLPAHNAYAAGTAGGGAAGTEWLQPAIVKLPRLAGFWASPQNDRGKARKERENTGKLWNSLPNVHADRLTARTGRLQCLQQRLGIIAEVPPK